jgi:hypothetical protein
VTNLSSLAFSSCPRLTAITADLDNPVFASEDGILFDKSLTTLIKYPMGLAGSYTISNRVTVLGIGAFLDCAGLTSVTIPSTINNLGDSLFENCGSLTNVIIPSSVTNIGYRAFSFCTSLPDITLPNSVRSIGDNAFNYCPGLASIIIPASVLSIGNSAFNGCECLTRVTIPDSVISIGMSPFYNCSSLTDIDVDSNNPVYSSSAGVLFSKDKATLMICPSGKAGNYTITNTCTRIDDNAFSGCYSLIQITIPSSVTMIGNWAFSRCSGLTEITLPNGITSIGMGMFEECNALASVMIPDSVTTIDNMAFNSCSSLTNITIPASVTSLGSMAFGWCFGLESVYFLGNAPNGMFVFNGASAATAYYLSGTTGWGSYIGGMNQGMGGIPTALWSEPIPLILDLPGTRFGVQSNEFGFVISGSGSQVFVVDACTNLANSAWLPIYTNTLTSGSASFSDPNWKHYPGRFYRVRLQ